MSPSLKGNVVPTDTAAPGTLETPCQVGGASHPVYASVSTGGPTQTPLEAGAAHQLPGAGGASDVA